MAASSEQLPVRQGEIAAYTVDEFCKAHRLSRSTLYQFWRDGAGPRKMQIGTKVLISVEAAADWRRAREIASAPAEGSRGQAA
jgi:predicted DNA-binding transcriptional regulator AlpA